MELMEEDRQQFSLAIRLPPREVLRLCESLINGEGLAPIWHALTEMRAEGATASSKEDLEHISHMIREGPGFKALDLSLIHI